VTVAAERGWKLDNVRDLARVFRLPGTTNRKTDTPVTARVLGTEGERHDMGALVGIVRRAARPAANPAPAANASDDLFDDAAGERVFTEKQAVAYIEKHGFSRLKEMGEENFNGPINIFAKVCSHFPWLVDIDRCARNVDKMLRPHDRRVTDKDYLSTIRSAYASTANGGDWVAVRAEEAADDTAVDRLKITSPADMAYWLEANAGAGKLSGLFFRGGQMVHTPRVNELGYVPAPEGQENGPAEIRPVTGATLAAKIQFLYRCFKTVDVKDEAGKKTGEKSEVAALFPKDAATRAVDAPEALPGLRPLRGITSTPMVRADGSVLAEPGYDLASGFLFLPGEGVAVPAVPDRPDGQDVARARKLLLDMVCDFPFATADDRANYFGLLLTPLLRQVAPPSYKLFGIGAHQPGSGKSLLAEIAGVVHGSVWRSEVPEDEAEWRKNAFSILSQTSAPLVVLDNIMGILRSSTLAGMLTAGQEMTDRELGTSRTITVANDRTWVVTGNNLSLGGDLVRRTITVLIDPDTPNPEQRTSFRVPDLKAWVAENRNEVLWSLLVLIRAWVSEGMPEPARAQSDSFARWCRVVAGILSVAGIEGSFDAESGKRVAAGGDDDGLFRLLTVLHERFADKRWTVSKALEVKGDGEGWLMESRDWLPMAVVDKLARSEAAGRISFGRWLQNRIGRWVTEDGVSLVLRSAGKDKWGALWMIEKR
jgi:hypothetical protein